MTAYSYLLKAFGYSRLQHHTYHNHTPPTPDPTPPLAGGGRRTRALSFSAETLIVFNLKTLPNVRYWRVQRTPFSVPEKDGS